jgi:hypothetical protein
MTVARPAAVEANPEAEADVDKVVKLLTRLRARGYGRGVDNANFVRDCRLAIAEAIDRVRDATVVYPGKTRKHLGIFAKHLKGAAGVLGKMPPEVQRRVGLLSYEALYGWGERIGKLSDRMEQPKHTGGKAQPHKRAAAEAAFWLLNEWTGRRPRNSKVPGRASAAPATGEFFRLADLLLKLATGREESCESQCRDFLKAFYTDLEADGIWGARPLRSSVRK